MNDSTDILIADSGATKTDWVRLTVDAFGERIVSYSGPGLSPLHHSGSFIRSELRNVAETLGSSFDRIRFYGAGIGTPDLELQMTGILSSSFNAEDITATSDVLGAAKALYGQHPGIACIMGTGSSSCHYDGRRIDYRVPSLGYILDDDGGGVAFGRRLLADIYKQLAPAYIRDEFIGRYGLTKEGLIRHLYQEASPNRWMASFFPFIAEHMEDRYMSGLIESQIDRFLMREFSGYQKETLTEEGISFVGSVAQILQERIIKAVERRGWKMGIIIRKPIEKIHNLIE